MGSCVVHGDKELIEKLGRNDPAPAAPDGALQENAVLTAEGGFSDRAYDVC